MPIIATGLLSFVFPSVDVGFRARLRVEQGLSISLILGAAFLRY